MNVVWWMEKRRVNKIIFDFGGQLCILIIRVLFGLTFIKFRNFEPRWWLFFYSWFFWSILYIVVPFFLGCGIFLKCSGYGSRRWPFFRIDFCGSFLICNLPQDYLGFHNTISYRGHYGGPFFLCENCSLIWIFGWNLYF
jgi:hypothetical protein